MKRYYGNHDVEPGIYFCLDQLSFKSMDEQGRLPGSDDTVYRRVPALFLLVVAPLVGLVYVIFLPLIGFLMLGRILLGKALELTSEAAVALARVLEPAWQPARAFLSRHRSARRRPGKRTDAWADETRREIEGSEEGGEEEER
jgi:hypothetical protein